MQADVAANFIAYSREKLLHQYWPRTRECLEQLSPDQIWWRPAETSNSIGNLLLHLNGNIRQWILTGLGGAPDERIRELEFARREPVEPAALVAQLDDTLRAADKVIAALTAQQLLQRRRIQSHDVTALEAVYHVVEHFSTHYGQIVYITKMLLERGLGFYAYLDTAAEHARKP